MAVVRPVADGCGAVGAGHGPVSSRGSLVSSQRVGALPRRRTHRPVEVAAAAAAAPALRFYQILGLSHSPVRPTGRRTHRTTGSPLLSTCFNRVK